MNRFAIQSQVEPLLRFARARSELAVLAFVKREEQRATDASDERIQNSLINPVKRL